MIRTGLSAMLLATVAVVVMEHGAAASDFGTCNERREF